jgi:hypothetical protein
MAVRAVRVLRVLVMLRTGGLVSAHTMRNAVTRQAELCYAARNQQTRIRRAMRHMTRDTAFSLDRSVLVDKWSLLVYVTFYAGRIDACCQSRLFKFETAMRIVAIAALQRAFQHFMMEWQLELVFDLIMTAQTELRFAGGEQLHTRNAGLLRVCWREEYVRSCQLSPGSRSVT